MISKPEAAYIFAPGKNILCGECVFLKDKTHCAYYGEGVPVSPKTGACNLYKQGEPDTVPYLEPLYTKASTGYMENSVGFGCRRCARFKVGQDACRKVEGDIRPYGCCNLWAKDSHRGSLSNEALVQILAKKPVVGLLAMASRQKS